MADQRGRSGSARDYRIGRLKGRWVVVWEEGGRRHRWRLIAENAAEARTALRDFARERDALRRPARGLTIAEAWTTYIAEKQAEGRPSVTRMKDAWEKLEPAFGDLAVSDISGTLVHNYISVRRRCVGDGTIHTELAYLRAATGAKIKLPSKPRPRSRSLAPEEARKLIDAAQMPHVRLFISLALHTAGRPSSILDLTWDRVDFRGGRIRLDNPARDRTAKGRAIVPLDSALVAPLKEAGAAAMTTHVIEWAGKPVASIKKGVREAARRAGLKGVTPYVLRHTAAVWMAEGGVPMEEIAQFMGRTSPAVTFRTYARYSPEYLQKAAGAISDRLAQGAVVLETEHRQQRTNKTGTNGD